MTVEPTVANRLLRLGEDLGAAAPSGDIIDMLAVGIGVKPMAGLATCYTADGEPAWDAIETDPAMPRSALGDRLSAAGFQWTFTPVETVRDDGQTFTWYELLLGADCTTLPEFLEQTGTHPNDRTEAEYGEALGYPDSAVEWFVNQPASHYDSAFEVIRHGEYDENAQTLAASVPYVPAPTRTGAQDAIDDGRELTDALGQFDSVVDDGWFAERLLGERVSESLATHDKTEPWRDPLHRAMG
ncbi:hypothetical protein ACFPYI_13090 [Halomarina salina]|uniref:Uncharacterized protein n=1 Tax=Halomarina salina TaxID=1872699 RepID=A0ABD5RPT0_9EURY|nr:hypothetical protein [Halomarina salina]